MCRSFQLSFFLWYTSSSRREKKMVTSLELLSLFYVWVFLSAFFISGMPPASQCHEGLDILAPYKIIGGAASPPPPTFFICLCHN